MHSHIYTRPLLASTIDLQGSLFSIHSRLKGAH
jgi:hypothetical protein